jgi:hypothetical protein
VHEHDGSRAFPADAVQQAKIVSSRDPQFASDRIALFSLGKKASEEWASLSVAERLWSEG